MNKPISNIFIFICLLFLNFSQSQEVLKSDADKLTSDVFSETYILPIKLSYSIKEIKKETNDSTYIDSELSYQLKDSSWQKLSVKLRGRGNNRLQNCYFPPVKVKMKKSDVKHTVFEDHRNLKLVLPCLLQKDNNDNVLKEYLAYKIFEIISPYHFNTRLLNIKYDETRNNRTKTHNLKGVFIEDDKDVAKRLDGKVYKRSMHPLNQEQFASVRNAFFQFMIGNTDFSQAYQHNIKVIYIDNEMIPIPFDFDMSGFVNTSYATVSLIKGKSLGMASVTDRKYRGFARDIDVLEQVRQDFISKKQEILDVMDNNSSFFDDSNEFSTARDYILSFYDVMVNDSRFKNEILDQLRTDN